MRRKHVGRDLKASSSMSESHKAAVNHAQTFFFSFLFFFFFLARGSVYLGSDRCRSMPGPGVV